jgi:hypothetical protein
MSENFTATHDKELALPGWHKYEITTARVERSYLTYYVYAEDSENAIELYYDLDEPDKVYVYDTDFEGCAVVEVTE